MLPDLKVTESSEALLTGRAPPFRLMARAIWRTGEGIPGIAPVLSEPFVVRCVPCYVLTGVHFLVECVMLE
jgi:hypothetical protein